MLEHKSKWQETRTSQLVQLRTYGVTLNNYKKKQNKERLQFARTNAVLNYMPFREALQQVMRCRDGRW